MGLKLAVCAFGGRGAGSPSNTMWPGPKPIFMTSFMLIHAAISPQETWAENWGLRPFGGRGAGSPSNTMWPVRGLPACQVSSSSVQPFGHSARTSRTGQTGQDNGPIAYGKLFYKQSSKNVCICCIKMFSVLCLTPMPLIYLPNVQTLSSACTVLYRSPCVKCTKYRLCSEYT